MSLNHKHLALAALVVPVLFLLRNIGQWSAVNEEHAKSEEEFSQHVKELDSAEAEAKIFGAGVDEEGCAQEALQRTTKDPSFSRTSTGASFLRGCLPGCRVTPGYCDRVPAYEQTSTPPEEAKKSDQWRKSLCAGVLGSDWTCAAQFKFVQLHCHPLK